MATRTITQQIHLRSSTGSDVEEAGGKRLCLEVYPMGSDEPITCDLIPVTTSNSSTTLVPTTSLRFQLAPVAEPLILPEPSLTTPFSSEALWKLLITQSFGEACSLLKNSCPLQERADSVINCLLEQKESSKLKDDILRIYFMFLQFLMGNESPVSGEDGRQVSMKYDLFLPLLNATAGRVHHQLDDDSCQSFTWTDFLRGMIDMFQKTFDKSDMEEVNLSIMDCIYVLLKKTESTDKRILNILLNLLQCSLLSTSGYIHLQTKALDLLSLVGAPSTVLPRSGQNLSDLMTWFAEDNDARIRERSIHCLLQWYHRGFPLSRSLYDVATRALRDEEERVREVAIQLLCGVIVSFPDSLVPSGSSSSSEEIRLADAGFAQLCALMQDACVRVRALTAIHLGRISKHVGESYLLQTLDKKVMSELRVKKSHLTSVMETKCEWASGRQWNADTPHGDSLAEVEITLLALGACGAIIHGLEDEFSDVRLATVEAVRRMGSTEAFQENSSNTLSRDALFPLACQDFLVDMLTDDLSIVRIRSVEALRHVASETTLRTEQLAIVLGGLREANDHMRWALHRLLDHSRLATDNCIMMLITALLANLRKYPEDQYSVWRCAAAVGKRHPEFVYLNVTQLLQLHSYLTAAEPARDDPHYITVLLMVLNACCPEEVNPKTRGSSHSNRELSCLGASLFHMLPEPHATRNVTYLREVVPELVPPHLPDGDLTRRDPGALFTYRPTSLFLNSSLQISSMKNENVEPLNTTIDMSTTNYLSTCQQRFRSICTNIFHPRVQDEHNKTTTQIQLPHYCSLLYDLICELQQVIRLTTPTPLPQQTTSSNSNEEEVDEDEFGAVDGATTVEWQCIRQRQQHIHSRALLHLYTAVLSICQAAALRMNVENDQSSSSTATMASIKSWRNYLNSAWVNIMMLIHLFHGIESSHLENLQQLVSSLSILLRDETRYCDSSKLLQTIQFNLELCTNSFPGSAKLGVAQFQLQEPPPDEKNESDNHSLFMNLADFAFGNANDDLLNGEEQSSTLDVINYSSSTSSFLTNSSASGLRTRRMQFIAGLAVSIPVRALLTATNRAQETMLKEQVQVCIESPDGRRVYWTPPSNAWSDRNECFQKKLSNPGENISISSPVKSNQNAITSHQQASHVYVSELRTAVSFSADKWSDSAWLSVYLVLRPTNYTIEPKNQAEKVAHRLKLTPTARIQVSVQAPKHAL